MKNKVLMLVMAVLGIVTVAAAIPAAFSRTNASISDQCDLGEYQHREVHRSANGTVTSKLIICPVLGAITFIHSSDGVTIDEQRTATPDEVAIYVDSLAAIDFDLSDARLAADIETGQKWVEKLREWSVDAQNYYDQWPTLNGEQNGTEKDAVMREMLRRQGLTWAGLADLLTVLDKGR